MKRLIASKIFDFVFGAVFLFLMFFVWVRYFLHDFWLTLVISSIATFGVMTMYHIYTKKRSTKMSISESDLKAANAISTKFLLLTKHEVLKEFCLNLNKKYKTEIKSDYILINDNILRPLFFGSVITDKDVIESYTKTKSLKAEKLILVCKEADESAKKVAKFVTDKKVLILEETDAYENIYKPLAFEIPEIEKPKDRKKFADYIAFAFCRQRTKNYILVSVFLLISSFVLRYNIYYIVFASITTILGLYSYFNRKYNTKQKQKIM